ncbi:IclR family transcriptional regulator [Telmatospirillum siberiense]|uniref:IclR family transcriptional regulator n=1 Tax=Telmatospirillum siberiense TaxID=382514 RepID=A0A2N3PTG2_9PROT|nr:IclR family transcriptional regulator [Telmatospirillum siberiense]PKU23684.1 IclR family transcriptional regulator [Telmatospirillum siberiense]
MPPAQEGVDAVNRALSILKAFDDDCVEMTLAALAKKTGLYKSMILRMAASLETCGFLWRDDNGLFRLGPELWRLGSLYRRGFDLGRHIRPALRHLVEATSESASFYILEGDHRLCLYRENSPRAIRHHIDEGVRFPLDRGAGGQVLAAFSTPDDPKAADIRAQGYYVSLGERDADVAAAAVPLIDAGGHLRGALSVSGLLSRFDDDARKNAIALLKKTAGELAAVLPALE